MPRTDPIFTFETRGNTVAKNPAIERNMDLIVTFDKRYNRFLTAHDAQGMRDLATWANDNGLTLSHKARQAAEEMT